jgi:hypothetical protein
MFAAPNDFVNVKLERGFPALAERVDKAKSRPTKKERYMVNPWSIFLKQLGAT